MDNCKLSNTSLPSFNISSEKSSDAALKPDCDRIDEIAATPPSDDNDVQPPPPPDGGCKAWLQCLMTHLVRPRSAERSRS